jgi:putative peptide zinc metalloprotease protein
MNLAEALNAALPDMPARKARVGYPRLDPALISNENIEDGKPVIVAMIRGNSSFFRFAPEQWRIIELFDGKRSWDDVAELHEQLYGVRYSGEDLREFTSGLDEIGFWYKTALEKNIALQQKLEEGRHQHTHKHSKWGDVAHMQFSAWDPDRYFDLIYPWLKWVYTKWFGLVLLALFGFLTYIFIADWGQIGQDTLLFYNFTQKTAADLAEFWVLFLILAFFHESAHGLTCKHYGGQVHSMGFHLIYLTPAFFVDVSEAFVYASRWQRFIIIMAGIGVELIFCAVATVVWWGTPPGSPVHDLAYKIMLITGVAVVVVNMNPLIKLDGYYAFSEIIGFSDIKEKATAYLSGMVRQKIFRLPVEVEFVSRRRRPGYIIYAILSGIYSYLLLFAVLRFCSNVFSRFSAEWAFIPALALGLLIFRSRIRTLVRFMKTVYLDKRDRIRAWLTLPRIAAGLAILLLVLFLPIWHETISARFLLEPEHDAVVHATVPGRVTSVLVQEGQQVHAGDALLTMVNANLESASAGSREQLALTSGERTQQQLGHGDLGAALQQHAMAERKAVIAGEESDQLVARSPIDGVVTAPHLSDLEDSYLDAGATITDIVDTRGMRALIYVPEFAVGEVRLGARVSLLVDGSFEPRGSAVDQIAPVSGEIPAAVETIKQIQGGAKLTDYIADVLVPNDGGLQPGMTGTAKIVVRRASIAGMTARELRDFVDRKIW